MIVMALAGRRVDPPDAQTPRFPSANETLVRERLTTVFRKAKVSVLVCSAACGADVLALEVAGQLGARRRIVLPYTPGRFRETSVVDRPGDWGERFDAVVKTVEGSEDLVVLRYSDDNESTYTGTNEGILDQAAITANALHQPLEALLVWEGATRGPDDVTANFGRAARARGIPVSYVLTI
ncbi:MAG: hypothetical protein AB7G75_04100 [Candidatus Binatia bacterium]